MSATLDRFVATEGDEEITLEDNGRTVYIKVEDYDDYKSIAIHSVEVEGLVAWLLAWLHKEA